MHRSTERSHPTGQFAPKGRLDLVWDTVCSLTVSSRSLTADTGGGAGRAPNGEGYGVRIPLRRNHRLTDAEIERIRAEEYCRGFYDGYDARRDDELDAGAVVAVAVAHRGAA